MKVRFIKSLISNVAGRRAGDVAEIGKEEAQRFIQAGIAVPVREGKQERATAATQAEQAVKETAENKPVRRRRRKK